MNFSTNQRTAGISRSLAVIAGIALTAAVLLGWSKPAVILPVYRLAVFGCLAPALGSVLFALVHRCTGGNWGDALQPCLAAGSRLAPWVWLLALPLPFFSPTAAGNWPDYESRAMIALRGAGGALVLFALATLLARERNRAAWIGPAGLIVLVFTLHVLADDWLTTQEPDWQSTAFPLVWMLGQTVAGLGCAVFVALLFEGTNHRASGRRRMPGMGLDWGNLLLTTMLLWCYVAFAQFLIIWAGNLPREISWYGRRMQGGWQVLPALLAVVHFIVPLAILLSRRLKQSARSLAAAAGTLVVAQMIYLAWVILPVSAPTSGLTVAFGLAACIGAFALFLNRYLTFAIHRTENP